MTCPPSDHGRVVPYGRGTTWLPQYCSHPGATLGSGHGCRDGMALPVPAAVPLLMKHSAGGEASPNPLFVSPVLMAALIGKHLHR